MFRLQDTINPEWQGAYNRVPSDATAFVRRDELFLFKHTVVAPDASTAKGEASRSWLARSWASVHPWGSEGVYPNLSDPNLEDWAYACFGPNYDRLLRVKKTYEPDDFSTSSRRCRAVGKGHLRVHCKTSR